MTLRRGLAAFALALLSGVDAAPAHAAAPSSLPPYLPLPAGTGVKHLEAADFDEHLLKWRGDDGHDRAELVEGKVWRAALSVRPHARDRALVHDLVAPLEKLGWRSLSPPGRLPSVARRELAGKRTWLELTAAGVDGARLVVVEEAPPPRTIVLSPPADEPIATGDRDDFPFLVCFPGDRLRRTTVASTPLALGSVLLVGVPSVVKEYESAPGVSDHELVAAYREALKKQGWTAEEDGPALVAHWARGKRDLWVRVEPMGAAHRFIAVDVAAFSSAPRLSEALAREGHVVLPGVYFADDEPRLLETSAPSLGQLVAALAAAPTLSVEVQDHVDDTHARPIAQKLSDGRARAVRDWLLAHGADAARVTAAGYADTHPRADNKTAEHRALNNRVEIVRR